MTREQYIRRLYYTEGLPMKVISSRLNITRQEIEDAVDKTRLDPVTTFVEVLDPRALQTPQNNVIIWTMPMPVGILASEIEVTE